MNDFTAFNETVAQTAIFEFETRAYIPLESIQVFDSLGNTNSIPVFNNTVAKNIADGVTRISDTLTESSIPLTFDRPLVVPTLIGQDQMDATNVPLAVNVGKKSGSAVSLGTSHRLASLAAIQGRTNAYMTAVADVKTLTPDQIVDEITALIAQFDLADVPMDDRYALLHPAIWREVAKSTFFGSRDFNQNYGQGKSFIEAAGIKWTSSNSVIWGTNLSANTGYESKYRGNFDVGNVDEDNIYCLLYQKDSLSLKFANSNRSEHISSRTDYAPTESAFLQQTRSHLGTAISQPTAIGILESVASVV